MYSSGAVGPKTYQLNGIAGCLHFRNYMYQELMHCYARSVQTSVHDGHDDDIVATISAL